MAEEKSFREILDGLPSPVNTVKEPILSLVQSTRAMAVLEELLLDIDSWSAGQLVAEIRNGVVYDYGNPGRPYVILVTPKDGIPRMLFRVSIPDIDWPVQVSYNVDRTLMEDASDEKSLRNIISKIIKDPYSRRILFPDEAPSAEALQLLREQAKPK